MKKIIFIAAISALLIFSCTDLKEIYPTQITEDQKNTLPANVVSQSLLNAVYEQFLLDYPNVSAHMCSLEATGDQFYYRSGGDVNVTAMTRHEYTATSGSGYMAVSWDSYNAMIFKTLSVLTSNPNPRQKAEARFLRAFFVFQLADMFNQVPLREPGEDLNKPAKVLKINQAIDFLVSELNAIIPDLPERTAVTNANVANKDAARVLLMKLYLNKGAFLNRTTSPTFAGDDMAQVISIGQQLIGSGTYSLMDNYYDNFSRDNDTKSKEMIFSVDGRRVTGGDVSRRWRGVLHANSVPTAGNTWVAPGSILDLFDPNDVRLSYDYPGFTDKYGTKVGLLIGQQYGRNATTGAIEALKNGAGQNLIFTRNLIAPASIVASPEFAGVRPIKWVPDMKDDGTNADNRPCNNDLPIFRYADVMLMTAEALLRTGQTNSALLLVNQLRVKRKASALTSLTLNNLIDERGRELYWEGWRRNDLIRFDKFNLPNELRPWTSDAKYRIYPIAPTQLSANPNLVQNFGY